MQDVAVGEQPEQDELERLALADDRALDLVEDATARARRRVVDRQHPSLPLEPRSSPGGRGAPALAERAGPARSGRPASDGRAARAPRLLPEQRRAPRASRLEVEAAVGRRAGASAIAATGARRRRAGRRRFRSRARPRARAARGSAGRAGRGARRRHAPGRRSEGTSAPLARRVRPDEPDHHTLPRKSDVGVGRLAAPRARSEDDATATTTSGEARERRDGQAFTAASPSSSRTAWRPRSPRRDRARRSVQAEPPVEEARQLARPARAGLQLREDAARVLDLRLPGARGRPTASSAELPPHDARDDWHVTDVRLGPSVWRSSRGGRGIEADRRIFAHVL